MEKKNVIRVTFWNEFRHEKQEEEVKKLYPNGIHAFVASFLEKESDIEVTLASLDDPDQGLPDSVLNNTDVLMWWGHMAHHEVDDALVERIRQRVYAGMGLIVLHSGHHSKVFRSVVGATGNLSWGRDQKEILWNLMPSHPICEGIPEKIYLETEELYAEPFYVPVPDELLFMGWYEDGNVFRSGMCYRRGGGKVFYFQPGHEFCRSYYNSWVQKIIVNAVRWAKPAKFGFPFGENIQLLGKATDGFNK